MLQLILRAIFPNYAEKHHKTVRYAFSFVFMLLLTASLAAVISSNTSYVKISTSKENVAKEEQFFVDISAYAHVPINAIDIVIDYPENAMTIESIDTGTSVITLWTQKPYAKNGKIYLRGGTFRQGFIGEHKIVRIKAKATKAGAATILVQDTQFIAGDGKGTIVNTSVTDDGSVHLSVTGSERGVLEAAAGINIITDTDGDGDVDLADISRFMAAWFKKDKTFDFNNDGRMTFADFSIILAESFFK